MLIRKKSGLLRSRVETACPVHSGRIPPDGTNRSPAAVRERWRGRSGGRKPDSQWPRHQTPLRTGSYDVLNCGNSRFSFICSIRRPGSSGMSTCCWRPIAPLLPAGISTIVSCAGNRWQSHVRSSTATRRPTSAN